MTDPNFGKTDSKYHSSIFKHATIRNRQTAFFERVGNDVIMITAGFAGRQWEREMTDIEPQIRQYLERLKDRLATQENG